MEIQNRDTKNAIIAATGITPSSQAIPATLSKVVVPVLDVNPSHNRVCNLIKSGSCSNAVSAVVFTAASDKDTYIVAATMSYIKDVTSTATSLNLEVVPEETSLSAPIVRFAGITLTAANGANSISFPVPIKLKRGSNVVLVSDTATANVLLRATLIGFTVDNF